MILKKTPASAAPSTTSTTSTKKKPKRAVKTYDAPSPGAGPQAGMPTSLFDPAWNDPRTASRVAFMLSRRLPPPDAATTLQPAPTTTEQTTDARRFVFPGVMTAADGRRSKGGSYGELHRRYTWGAQTANFHAQAVAFGVDDAGTFFLTGTVGRFDGPWGNEGTLAAVFCAGDDVVGAAVWQRALDPVGDHKVVVCGRDAGIAARFDAIDSARVLFSARTGLVASDTDVAARPRLSRARRSVLEGEVRAALAASGDERQRRLLRAFASLHEDDVVAVVAAVGGSARDDLLNEVRALIAGATP